MIKKTKRRAHEPGDVLCPVLLRWGQSLIFLGEGAGHFRYKQSELERKQF